MGPPLYILCYHRVLRDSECGDVHEPYFARGSAITEAAFRQQVRDIKLHFECLSEGEILKVLSGEYELHRPSCWITFDDAYADVFQVAAPILKDAGLVASLFVATSVLDGTTLPVDRWYITLNSAQRRKGKLLFAGLPERKFDLDDPGSYSSLIDGSEKRRFLQSSPDDQDEMISALSHALDSSSTVPAFPLYLNTSQLTKLNECRWSIGSHSVSHALFPFLSDEERQVELNSSRIAIQDIGLPIPRSFAYPDGAWNDASRAAVQTAGYELAVALDPHTAISEHDWLAMPRLMPADSTDWVRDLVL